MIRLIPEALRWYVEGRRKCGAELCGSVPPPSGQRGPAATTLSDRSPRRSAETAGVEIQPVDWVRGG